MMGKMTGHLAACGSASRYMARRKATRQATELTMVLAYYMLYGYIAENLVVDKPQLQVKNVMMNYITTGN